MGGERSTDARIARLEAKQLQQRLDATSERTARMLDETEDPAVRRKMEGHLVELAGLRARVDACVDQMI